MCTRFVYQGPEGRILTARSMDWVTDTGTNLWRFPRGLERDGAAGRLVGRGCADGRGARGRRPGGGVGGEGGVGLVGAGPVVRAGSRG